MIRASNHLLSIVFRFHYHPQKVIGSLGNGFKSSEANYPWLWIPWCSSRSFSRRKVVPSPNPSLREVSWRKKLRQTSGFLHFFSRQKWYFYLKSPFCLEPERLHNNNTCPQLVLFFFLRSPWTKMMRFDRSKSSKMKFRFICQHCLLCFPYFKAKILHFWAEVTKTLCLRAGPCVRYHDVSYGSPYRRRWWPRLKFPSWLMVDPNTENTATQKRSGAELRILRSTLPETNSSFAP